MSKKVTYLLGAGASVGAVPAVGKFNLALSTLATAREQQSFEALIGLGILDGNEKDAALQQMQSYRWPEKLQSAAQMAARFGTVDTYAKSLSLKQQNNLLIDLKHCIDLTITLKQAERGVDPRYYGWLSALMNRNQQNGEVSFPPGINILSWNYDNQIEMALADLLHPRLGLALQSEEFIASEIVNFPFYHKLNGRSGGLSTRLGAQGHERVVEMLLNAQEYGEDLRNEIAGHVAGQKIHPQPNISFAWDGRFESNKDAIREAVATTEILVVVGYSFPAFNRKIDTEIFKLTQANSRPR